MASPKDVTLYYFRGSYYSLKVFHALHEKNVPFKEKYVFILAGTQNQKWFLEKNDKGEVPVLEIDGKCYSESENIIDVIDQTFPSSPRLVPDKNTAEGREVQAFRKMLHDLNIPVITFGTFANRQFCVEKEKPDQLPSWVATRPAIHRRFSGEVASLIKTSESCAPEMKEAINAKIVKVSRKLADLLDPEIVSKHLDELEDIFDKIAARLEKSKRENNSSKDVWLFGSTFTAADITAVALMIRLNFIGIAPRYFSSDVRPLVHDYFTRALERPAVKKVTSLTDGFVGILGMKRLATYGVKAGKIGLFLGLVTIGYIGLKEFLKGK